LPLDWDFGLVLVIHQQEELLPLLLDGLPMAKVDHVTAMHADILGATEPRYKIRERQVAEMFLIMGKNGTVVARRKETNDVVKVQQNDALSAKDRSAPNDDQSFAQGGDCFRHHLNLGEEAQTESGQQGVRDHQGRQCDCRRRLIATTNSSDWR
jgi:hypothetical protein